MFHVKQSSTFDSLPRQKASGFDNVSRETLQPANCLFHVKRAVKVLNGTFVSRET